ncbi:spore germination protein [Alkalihalobacillus sp. AL-G]|uniref:spore germination protein n=1 Tax=Alkalihalobacillus sp. AL-G TaxID=2926399 RepID=UPI00272B8CD3|nr:spore germination protein [Alkalihalobacillus sp. AL-G]WLD91586.1 spore germination protein [Alkalihalobacillus sp. AL-G]
MPSIILAPIKITSVSGDGTVSFGDVFYNAPKSTSKSASGAGGGNTGDFMTSTTIFNITLPIDPDASDSDNIGNV